MQTCPRNIKQIKDNQKHRENGEEPVSEDVEERRHIETERQRDRETERQRDGETERQRLRGSTTRVKKKDALLNGKYCK